MRVLVLSIALQIDVHEGSSMRQTGCFFLLEGGDVTIEFPRAPVFSLLAGFVRPGSRRSERTETGTHVRPTTRLYAYAFSVSLLTNIQPYKNTTLTLKNERLVRKAILNDNGRGCDSQYAEAARFTYR